MNLNASLYSNAVTGLEERFSVSNAAARVGQMIFLVAYAFGCELWAPWSEEYGRWPIMQLSLLFVNSKRRLPSFRFVQSAYLSFSLGYPLCCGTKLRHHHRCSLLRRSLQRRWWCHPRSRC